MGATVVTTKVSRRRVAMKNASRYFVWRRNDGYISSTCGTKPVGWRGTDGSIHSFEYLGEFDHWPDAYSLIDKLRKEANESKQEKPNNT